MTWFFGGLAFLVLGYLTYGKFVEKVFGPDDRKTPAVSNPDGVDIVPLPQWKNLLIQLLNIAGVGPVIGVILGIKFGKVALLIIPVGCVLMGAVHDFAVGMMSLRMNGANMPKIVGRYLGEGYSKVFSGAMIGLLLLCVTVFINVPHRDSRRSQHRSDQLACKLCAYQRVRLHRGALQKDRQAGRK